MSRKGGKKEMRRFMKKFRKQFRYGEKGFTLIELLIVVAILGILAAVIVPNLATFLGTGKVAAANTEVANVESAALAYYADNDGAWPTDCTSADVSLMDPPGTASAYLDNDPKENYGFDAFGKVVPPTFDSWDGDATLQWIAAEHKWEKD